MVHGEVELLQLDQLGQRLGHRICIAIEIIMHSLSPIEPETTIATCAPTLQVVGG